MCRRGFDGLLPKRNEAGDAEPVRGIGGGGPDFPHPECGVFPHSCRNSSTRRGELYPDRTLIISRFAASCSCFGIPIEPGPDKLKSDLRKRCYSSLAGRQTCVLLLLLCCLSASARADEKPAAATAVEAARPAERTVSGKVTDEHGNPLIGATIVVKGCSDREWYDHRSGRLLLADGARAFDPCSSPGVGYKSLTLPVLNRDELKIVLEEEAERLDNVVVGVRNAVEIGSDGLHRFRESG